MKPDIAKPSAEDLFEMNENTTATTADRPGLREAEARAAVYRFMSAAYLAPPQRDFLRDLANGDLVGELARVLEATAVPDPGSLVSRLSVKGGPGALRQEYYDLFAVPAGRYVFPFEDVHRGAPSDGSAGKGPLLGKWAIAAMRMYRQAGARLNDSCTELPTHVGVELSFMSFLCQQQVDAARQLEDRNPGDSPVVDADLPHRYRQLQLRFLSEHLTEWFPMLRRAVEANASTDFYPGYAQFTDEFLSRDAATLLAAAQLDGE